MPLIFAVIYISIPAGVNTYFIVSSLFRIAQQEYMYRRDPQLQESVARLRDRTQASGKVMDAKLAPTSAPLKLRSLFGRGVTPALQAGEVTTSRPGYTPPRSASNGSNGRAAGKPGSGPANGSAGASSKAQPRAQGKRQRRPR
jgi:YidC/Oxa1 family membrane protein insertase